MDDQTADDLQAVTAEPDQLDGHTIDDLADYLDAGRIPLDAGIETSAACRRALAALERLRTLAPQLLVDDDDPAVEAEDDDTWTRNVLSRITLDAHDGADFLIARSDDGDETVMTEGALRALLRDAGDEEPGFLVGRIHLTGDLAGDEGPVIIDVEVIVAHGVVIPDGVARLRNAILRHIRRHTRLEAPRIDITVRDLIGGDT